MTILSPVSVRDGGGVGVAVNGEGLGLEAWHVAGRGPLVAGTRFASSRM